MAEPARPVMNSSRLIDQATSRVPNRCLIRLSIWSGRVSKRTRCCRAVAPPHRVDIYIYVREMSPCTLFAVTSTLVFNGVLPLPLPPSPLPPLCPAPRGVLLPSAYLHAPGLDLLFGVKERPRIVPISPYCPSNDICPAAEAARVLRFAVRSLFHSNSFILSFFYLSLFSLSLVCLPLNLK